MFFDIARRIRMIGQPLDMFANHPAIFLGEFPDELYYTVFDSDPHDISVQSPSSFLAFSQEMKSPFASISSRSRSSASVCVPTIIPYQQTGNRAEDQISFTSINEG